MTMWNTIPELGTGILVASLVGSGYTFFLAALSIVHPRLLNAARRAAYGTTALCALAVVVLAYAFATHDFRLSYVVRYSDRSMPVGYLLSALWGGQEGSLLLWMLLLASYSSAFLAWLRDRYRTFQPFVIATLMGTVAFFGLVTLVAGNPFPVGLAGPPLDGRGLNPLLQDFFMVVHPPALFLGFARCTVPFSLVIAALFSGRLDSSWIRLARPWMLLSWIFLTVGNALGMIWAYEELGWGGYWAWDPVENASLLPWLTATAFLHSASVQERKPMFIVWNVLLVALTFFLTLFGTFLTRSGVIASVHAFAESSLGSFFLYFLAILIVLTLALFGWRWRHLRTSLALESHLSREATLAASNWTFLLAGAFVLIATTLPILSQAVVHRSVSVGPEFFNRWITPIGLGMLSLMGVAPLLGWKTTSRASFRRGFLVPATVALVVAALHIGLGSSLGFPALSRPEALGDSSPPNPGTLTTMLEHLGTIVPLVTVGLVAFNVAVLLQAAARTPVPRSPQARKLSVLASFRALSHARRRLGGGLAHLGILLMFLGFLGSTWGQSDQASILPGQSVTIQNYTLHYDSFRVQPDPGKDMYLVDLAVSDTNGSKLGRISPAKFVYRTHKDQPTTEVAVLRSVRSDLYVVLGSLSTQSGRASLQVYVNPLVSLVWLGVSVLVLGACLSLWPSKRSASPSRQPFTGDTLDTTNRPENVDSLSTKILARRALLFVIPAATFVLVGAYCRISTGLLTFGGVLLLLGVWNLWMSLQIAIAEEPPAHLGSDGTDREAHQPNGELVVLEDEQPPSSHPVACHAQKADDNTNHAARDDVQEMTNCLRRSENIP